MNAMASTGGAASGYIASFVAGTILLVCALAMSFVIPKAEDCD